MPPKKVILSFHLYLLAYTFLAAQPAESGYLLLSGEIISPAKTPIEGVHILNTQTNDLAVTDAGGFFSIQMHTSHLLRISAVGYKTYYFKLKPADLAQSNYFTITLQTVTVGLQNVDIIAKEEPRAEYLFRPTPQPALFSFGYQGQQKEVKATLLNPVSLLYNWLSKEGKQKRKLEEILKQEEVKQWVAKRYESDIVWELTGYTGQELEAFKAYCGLTDYFVAHASDYEFLVKIRDCYNTYTPAENN